MFFCWFRYGFCCLVATVNIAVSTRSSRWRHSRWSIHGEWHWLRSQGQTREPSVCCHYSSHFKSFGCFNHEIHDWGISFRYFSWLSAHFSQTISASSQRKWSHTATAKHMATTASAASTASTATTATRTASTWSLPVMALRRRWGAHVENIIWDVWDEDVYTFNTTSFNIP